MSPRRRRGLALALVVLLLGGAGALVLSAFRQNLVFFFSPSQVQAGEVPQGRAFRLGGLVEAGSLQRSADGLDTRFVVTDQLQRVAVQYRGLLPDLFKEGKGVVAQGRLGQEGLFLADEVLAKHDENYVPPEAARALEAARQAGEGRP